MTHIKKIFILLLLLPSLSFALSNKELATTINLAGKQRMLSQKITKEIFLIKSNIDRDKNIKNIKKSTKLFEQTLNGLINGDKELNLVAIEDEKIQKRLKIIEKIWEKFHKDIKNILQNSSSKKSYQSISKINLQLLKDMNKVVEMYVKKGDSSNLKSNLTNDINLAGKQRMLTQKMAKEILLITNDIDTKKNKQNLQSTIILFDKILRGLQNGDNSLNLKGTKLTKIQKELKIAQKNWEDIKPSLNYKKLKKDKKRLKNSILKLDSLLTQMNSIVSLYENSIRKEKLMKNLSAIVGNFMELKSEKNHVINLAGKQRMLTQKISKLSLLIASNIAVKSNKEELKKASNLYNKTLNGFINGDKDLQLLPTTDKNIIKQLKSIQAEWKPFYKHIKNISNSKKINPKDIVFIASHNENLLKISNNLVQLYKKNKNFDGYMDVVRTQIIDVAGRQRMLTQKMAKEKLLTVANLDQTSNQKKLDKTINLFENSLLALLKGDENIKVIPVSNKSIKKQLIKVQTLWEKLKPLYIKKSPNSRDLAKIIKLNPILLKEMNKAVHMSELSIDY